LRAALLALILGCLAACAQPALPAHPAAGAAAAGSVFILVARRKWHIDVGFASADLDPSLAPVARRFPGASYLFFGFGDRHYLLAKKQGTPDMLGALWPGAALVLVTAIENTPSQAFGASHVMRLRVTAAQARAAQAFIRHSLGGTEPYAAGPYASSLYFAATERYSALHTCNTWAAEALRAGGLPVRSGLVVFAGQLWRQLQRLADSPGASLPESAPSAAPQSQGGGLPF
jgi:hypothetical protein